MSNTTPDNPLFRKGEVLRGKYSRSRLGTVTDTRYDVVEQIWEYLVAGDWVSEGLVIGEKEPDPETNDKNDFQKVAGALADLLTYKNEKYGNSALNPINVFAGKSKVGQRADDKISRIQNSTVLQKNDVADLMGYLVLICVENGWDTFDEFKD